MDTEELLKLQSELAHTRNLRSLRRIRFLLSGNRSAKDRLSSRDGSLAPLLASLVDHVNQLAEQLTASESPDALDLPSAESSSSNSSSAHAEASEIVLILHSVMITHPGAFIELGPRRLVANLLCLMHSRTYELILSCLRFLHALCLHCLPHASPALQPSGLAIVLASADLLSDAKLLKLLLLSMSKNSLVRELILGIFAGLAFAGQRSRNAIEAVAAFDACCPLSGLRDGSENCAFYTLLCTYSLLANGSSEETRTSLAMRLFASPAVLTALSDLQGSPHAVPTRCIALALSFHLLALCPQKASELRCSFLAQALFGFVQVLELAAQPSGATSLGEVGRLAFWDFILCMYAVPAELVGLAAQCKRLLALTDAVTVGDDVAWREVQLSLLGVCANRLEATRLQAAALPTCRRLLHSASSSECWTPLVVELHLIFSLSRSIEVLRSLLTDHPRLGDYALAIVRRAMAVCESPDSGELPAGVPQQILTLALQLLANLSLPVAGALRQRLLHLEAPLVLAEIANDAGTAFGLRPRQVALAGLANLALRADSADLGVSLELEAKGRQRAGAGSPRAVSVHHPLPPSALLKLVTEAEEMGSVEGQLFAACVANFARNVLADSGDLCEEEEEEEEDGDGRESGLARLLAKFVALLMAPGELCGSDAKEAALLALASSVALRAAPPQVAAVLSPEALCERLLAFVRQPRWSVALQEAALFAGLRLTEGLELLPWRLRFRQEVAKAELLPLLRSDAGRFLRERLRRAAVQEQQEMEELGGRSGSESS